MSTFSVFKRDFVLFFEIYLLPDILIFKKNFVITKINEMIVLLALK